MTIQYYTLNSIKDTLSNTQNQNEDKHTRAEHCILIECALRLLDTANLHNGTLPKHNHSLIMEIYLGPDQ